MKCIFGQSRLTLSLPASIASTRVCFTLSLLLLRAPLIVDRGFVSPHVATPIGLAIVIIGWGPICEALSAALLLCGLPLLCLDDLMTPCQAKEQGTFVEALVSVTVQNVVRPPGSNSNKADCLWVLAPCAESLETAE